DRVDVLAREQLLVLLGGERLRVGDLLPPGEVLVPDVADGGDADVRQLGERPQQVLAAAADADEADLEGVVGGEPAGRFGEQAGGGQPGGEELAAVGGHGEGSVWGGHPHVTRGRGESEAPAV